MSPNNAKHLKIKRWWYSPNHYESNGQFDQAVGRKLLLVDELPQGALARYERDVAAIAYVVSRRGAVPDQIQEGEEILVPTFEIAANPQVRLSEIKARRFYIVDRAGQNLGT